MTTFRDALAAGPLVLDGGMSNELEAQGHDLSGTLWSARLLRDDPDAIAAVHRAYFAAGAQVAITAGYQATYEGFARLGISRTETTTLLRRSVSLAREAAAAERDGRRWVAASVGPYGAMLADGSEYRGDYGLTVAELTRFHRPRLEALAEAGPDVFAVETIPDLREAEAVLIALDGLGIPAWLSYSIRGTTTSAGQPLTEAFALARSSDAVIAAGVNCAPAADAAAALDLVTGVPGVVYPNGGGVWDAGTRGWLGAQDEIAELAPSWLRAGASLVGGCCRVGPAEIKELAGRLHAAPTGH
ncbi:homocysteine S-methyltransferase [Streptomyces sp. ME02-8801-2C]|uniref:homocysteine S-methyltransferase n=1 Tax=Streptomyces sp. ME02-8801-2C TaxID=3028680 RepID=UPI0029B610F1|nr:homocysteine S-methyltransferase [Streptomyces sp. ME02-8801-2C]MDX3452546.1 homocysteine S-methyltransferase [Streptomyces sp. ME02-8801-2C]